MRREDMKIFQPHIVTYCTNTTNLRLSSQCCWHIFDFLKTFYLAHLIILVVFQMVGMNHVTLPVPFKPEHPGQQRINLDQRFLFSYMEQSQG